MEHDEAYAIISKTHPEALMSIVLRQPNAESKAINIMHEITEKNHLRHRALQLELKQLYEASLDASSF